LGTQNIILDDFPNEDQIIGLITTEKKLPNHEFFYHLNNENHFFFKRIDDLKYSGKYYDYFFQVFEGSDNINRINIKIICNKSISSLQKKEIKELFIEESTEKYLFNKDFEYIIQTSECINDFSLILHSKILGFNVQEYILSSHEELYQTLQL
jgi:hypothetical protein